MYINPTTLSNQSTPAPGLLPLTAEQEATYLQYNGFVKLTIEDVAVQDSGNDYTVQKRITNMEPDTEAWETWKSEQPDPLDGQKTARIQQSKTDLANYLATHPLQWTDGQYYSITAEKQAQLTSKIMAATMAAQTATPYTLTWNSTGDTCTEWALADLSALAFAIDARVTALVSYQQTQEVAIRNAATQDELDAIIIDYDTVQ